MTHKYYVPIMFGVKITTSSAFIILKMNSARSGSVFMKFSYDSWPLKRYPYLEYPIVSAPVSMWSFYLVGIHSARTHRHAHPWRPDHTFTVTTPHTFIYFADSIRQCSAPSLQFNRLK
jgi:hypothetical protein